MKKCILCNEEFTGWGHNPAPLAEPHFKCCSVCNDIRVIPYRIYQLSQSKKVNNVN
tara:strand:- start:453 stop:620 length:168 start_codon:yes stop_codon:yes gene_type:complete